MVNIKPIIRETMDKANSQNGGPEGILDIITIGEVNGIMLAHTIIWLSGVSRLLDMIIKPNMIGIMIGSIRDCAS